MKNLRQRIVVWWTGRNLRRIVSDYESRLDVITQDVQTRQAELTNLADRYATAVSEYETSVELAAEAITEMKKEFGFVRRQQELHEYEIDKLRRQLAVSEAEVESLAAAHHTAMERERSRAAVFTKSRMVRSEQHEEI